MIGGWSWKTAVAVTGIECAGVSQRPKLNAVIVLVDAPQRRWKCYTVQSERVVVGGSQTFEQRYSTVPGACRHDQKAVIGTEEPEAEPYLWAKHPSHFSLRLYTRFGPTGF